MAGLRRKYVNSFARKIWRTELGRVRLPEHKNSGTYFVEVLHGFVAQVFLVRPIATNKYPCIEVSET